MKKPKWMILFVVAFFGLVIGTWVWSYILREIDWATWQEFPIFLMAFLYFALDFVVAGYAYAKACGI